MTEEEIRQITKLMMKLRSSAKSEAPSPDPAELVNTVLLKASKALLQKIDQLTTDEFSKGGEKEEREHLRAVIAAIENDLPIPFVKDTLKAMQDLKENGTTPYEFGRNDEAQS